MRKVLLASAVVLFVGHAACSSSDDGGGTPESDAGAVDTRPATPAEWDRAVTRVPEATAAASRASCTFARGALADESLGSEVPTGKDIPIENIVVLMQENRSFDHYFGAFNKYAGRTDVESAPADASNPRKTGGAEPGDAGAEGGAEGGAPAEDRVTREHAEHLCMVDLDHSWEGSHAEHDDGKNDGFFEANDGPGAPGERSLQFYDERDLPFYYELAKSFGIGDHYHASVMGPTWPNRMYLFAATSFGLGANSFPNVDAYTFPTNDSVVLDELEKRHVDWRLYTGGGPAGATVVVGLTIGTRWGRPVVFTMDDFYADAAAGKLPAVAFVDGNFIDETSTTQTEHPPADIQAGQKFVAGVVKGVMTSPQWKSSAFFLMYDEHGGFYDHVDPPPACDPDGLPPVGKDGVALDGHFDNYGFRVPFLVVSPYAKRGYVSHTVYDHTSVTRFIEAKFRLPALTKRDANAAIPVDFFDFSKAPDLGVPTLPEATIDQAALSYCQSTK